MLPTGVQHERALTMERAILLLRKIASISPVGAAGVHCAYVQGSDERTRPADNDENAPDSPFAAFNRHGSEYNVLDSPDSPFGYDPARLTPFGMVRVTRFL